MTKEIALRDLAEIVDGYNNPSVTADSYMNLTRIYERLIEVSTNYKDISIVEFVPDVITKYTTNYARFLSLLKGDITDLNVEDRTILVWIDMELDKYK